MTDVRKLAFEDWWENYHGGQPDIEMVKDIAKDAFAKALELVEKWGKEHKFNTNHNPTYSPNYGIRLDDLLAEIKKLRGEE